MPESIGPGSSHTDRLHHHRAQVARHRRQVDQATRDAAAKGYAPNGQSSTDTGPSGAGNESNDRNH